MLTAKQARDLWDYDPKTGVIKWKSGQRAGMAAGTLISSGYIQISHLGERYLAHRLAWFIMKGEWPQHHIDHINRVSIDNRWANLREATHTQNSHNASIRKDNTSGAKGVSWDRSKKKWCAQIRINGKKQRIGCYETKEAAAAAYQRAAKEAFDQFAH